MRTLESLARIELQARRVARSWNGSRRPASLRAVSLLVRCGNGSPHRTGMPMAGSDWSRRTELVLLDHDQAKEADQPGAGDGRGAQDASIGCRRAIA